MAKKWTKEEVEFLIRAFPSKEYDLEMMSKCLSRSQGSISQKARGLGLTRPSRCWTKEEVEFLTRAYPSEEYDGKEIAQLLNRTISTVRNKARELKLNRPIPKDDSPPGYKKCAMCEVIAPLDHFFKDRSTKDGLRSYCKRCFQQYNQRKKSETKSEHPVFVETKSEHPVFVETKKCSRCGVEKPLVEYYKSKKTKDGHMAQCKECKNEINRKWRITGGYKYD